MVIWIVACVATLYDANILEDHAASIFYKVSQNRWPCFEHTVSKWPHL